MGVEPLRAGAQRNLGRGPQRAIGAPSGDAAGPTEIRERSLSHPQILLQSLLGECRVLGRSGGDFDRPRLENSRSGGILWIVD
jgi:hypothetical protein